MLKSDSLKDYCGQCCDDADHACQNKKKDTIPDVDGKYGDGVTGTRAAGTFCGLCAKGQPQAHPFGKCTTTSLLLKITEHWEKLLASSKEVADGQKEFLAISDKDSMKKYCNTQCKDENTACHDKLTYIAKGVSTKYGNGVT